jgi:predicted nucleic acid-binding protein
MMQVVISDTDIIVHLITGGVFNHIFPNIINRVYITPKVDEELRKRHGIYSQLTSHFGVWMFRTKDLWKDLSPENRIAINKTKNEHRAKLDPGELDCLAYAVGLNIDAIISDDRGAKEIINAVTQNQKAVITFWDLLIIGAIKDKLSWSDAELYYNQVVYTCNLGLPPFHIQIKIFEGHFISHPWVQQYLNS